MGHKIRLPEGIKYKKVLFAAGIGSLFLSVVFFVVFCEGGNVTQIFPTWNDEGGYYRQLAAMVQYGHPLGYNGYNGNHAELGNFGFHGMFILFPYYLWAKIFGLSYMTISACNIFMIVLAILIFSMCVEGDIWKYIAFAGCILTPMVVYYTATSMVEAENYFFSILLAGFLLRLYRKRDRRILIVAWAVIVFAVLCKVTWAGMVFPFAFISQKKERNIIFKIINSVLCMTIFMVAGYLIFSRFSSPYLTSILADYLTVMRQEGIWETFIYIIKNTIQNLGLTFAAVNTPDYALWFKVSALIVWLTFIFSIISILYSVRKKDIVFFWPGFIMVGYMGGVALMYTGGPVAIRTLYPAVLLCLLLLSDLYAKKKCAVIIGGGFLALTLSIGILKRYDSREFYDQKNQEYVQRICDFYKDLLIVQETGDEWENTVAMYTGDMPNFYYAMLYPAGMANNLYDHIPDNTEKFPMYALAVSADGDWYNFLMENGYREIGTNEEVILMADFE